MTLELGKRDRDPRAAHANHLRKIFLSVPYDVKPLPRGILVVRTRKGSQGSTETYRCAIENHRSAALDAIDRKDGK